MYIIKLRMRKFSDKKGFGGQVVIIVLLIMIVALTIGLSISSRSIRDIRISTRTEESQRAFSAAEAGLEAALAEGPLTGSIGGAGSGVSYRVERSNVGGGDYFIFPDIIKRDDTQQVWLVNHEEDDADGDGIKEELLDCSNPNDCYKEGSIEIYWGNEGTPADRSTTPALEVSIIYKEGGDYKIRKYAYDSNSGRGNNFTVVPSGSYSMGGKTFSFKVIQSLPSADEITALRLRLLYNDVGHILGVKSTGGGTIPLQGKLYNSKGYAAAVPGGSGVEEVRKITFFKSYPFLPGIFDFVLFSGSDLSKPAPQ